MLKLRALDRLIDEKDSTSKCSPRSESSDRENTKQLEGRVVVRDMLSMRVACESRLQYKSRLMFMLPDCLRLTSEVSAARYADPESLGFLSSQ